MSLRDELFALRVGEVADDSVTLTAASRDTSLFEVRPAVVVAPQGETEIEKLVTYASGKGGTVTLTARSAGTGMDGGALSESIVLDFTKHFRRIKAFSKDTAVVEPGVYYRDFERETLKRGLLMPSYPASRELCAVGGMVANNAGGELTLTYGKVADYVKALRVVLSDGKAYVIKPLTLAELHEKILQTDFEGSFYREMYRLIKNNKSTIETHKPKVTKNSAGYALWDVLDEQKGTFDLTRLFTGSQGTLGLITEITFGLIRPKEHSQMLVVFLDDLSKLPAIVKTVLGTNPTTFESYDDKTLSLALKFFWEFVKRLGFFRLLGIAWGNLPSAWSIITKGLPKLVLQVTWGGDDRRSIHEQSEVCKAALQQFAPRLLHLTGSQTEVDEYWMIRRESFNLLRTHVQGKKTAPFIDDIVVPVDTLDTFLPKLNAILDEYKQYMVHNIAGHIGNGNFHIIPLMDVKDPKVREKIPEIAKRVYDLVFEYHGSSTGEHNDGLIRTPFLQQQFGPEMYKLFEETKKIFDPKGIFNPRKKVGGSMEYALAHIAQK
jgi:FAD/FMN-containing dehydrogenase